MVGVQVADQHGIDVDVIPVVTQLGEHPVAAVEQQRVSVLLDQVSAACPVGVLPRWRLAKHGDTHASPLSVNGSL